MAKKVNSDYLYKLISLLCAIGLWFYVAYAENPQQEKWVKNIPVVYTGGEQLSANSLIIVDGQISAASVKVSGRRKNIALLKQNTITATVDLSDIKSAGTYKKAIDIAFPIDGISITDKKPYSIDVVVEKLITHAVPVNVELVGEVADGMVVDTVKANPETILIKGAQSKAQQIGSALVKVDIKDAAENITGRYGVSLKKADGSDYKGDGITVLNNEVEVEVSFANSKIVPIVPDITSPDGEIASVVLETKDTEITFGDAAANIESIKTLPLSVNYSEEPIQVSLSLSVPEGITSSVMKTVATVTFKSQSEQPAEER